VYLAGQVGQSGFDIRVPSPFVDLQWLSTQVAATKSNFDLILLGLEEGGQPLGSLSSSTMQVLLQVKLIAQRLGEHAILIVRGGRKLLRELVL